MKNFLTLVAAAVVLLGGSVTLRAQTYFVSTDITGAQTQIDINHLSSWIVGINSDVSVMGGKFVMKDGSQTTGSLTFSIYTGALSQADITSGTNNPFASITLSNADFDAQVNNGQTFSVHTFNFSNVVTLTAGNTYTAALTSTVPDVQSQAYFIKGGTQVWLVDCTTGATNTTSLTLTGGTGAVTNLVGVPEPSTYALLGLGGLALVVAWRRKTA